MTTMNRQSKFTLLLLLLEEQGLKGQLTATDIAEKVVVLLENCGAFNAGKGSVFSESGKHEMEASIMEGKQLRCGAVSLLHNLKNPVRAARDVMDSTQHVYVAGRGATKHIRDLLVNTEPENYYEAHKRAPPSFEDDAYFYTEKRWKSYQKVKLENESASSAKSIRSEDEDQLTQGELYAAMLAPFTGYMSGMHYQRGFQESGNNAKSALISSQKLENPGSKFST